MLVFALNLFCGCFQCCWCSHSLPLVFGCDFLGRPVSHHSSAWHNSGRPAWFTCTQTLLCHLQAQFSCLCRFVRVFWAFVFRVPFSWSCSLTRNTRLSAHLGIGLQMWQRAHPQLHSVMVACLVCTVEPSIVFICQFHAPVCVCLCLLRNLRAVQARNSICAYMASCFRGGCALWIQTEGMRNNIATHNTILPSPITSSHLQTPPSTDGQHPLSKFHNVHADRQNPGFQSWLKIFM